jgi:hypothetical protein
VILDRKPSVTRRRAVLARIRSLERELGAMIREKDYARRARDKSYMAVMLADVGESIE